MKDKDLYPNASREISKQKASLAPEIMETWRNFSRETFKDGALPEKPSNL